MLTPTTDWHAFLCTACYDEGPGFTHGHKKNRVWGGAIEKVKKRSRQAAQNHMPARRLLRGDGAVETRVAQLPIKTWAAQLPQVETWAAQLPRVRRERDKQ